MNHNKDRSYSYDALGRLTQAKGGQSGALWTQTYSYDRYGNRTAVTASGYSAKLNDKLKFVGPSGTEPGAVATGPSTIVSPTEPKVELPTDLLAKNNSVELPEALRTEDNRAISDTSAPLYDSSSAEKAGSSTNKASAKRSLALSPQGGGTNVAAASAGAIATAQNYTQDGVYPGLHFQPSYANDGIRYITPSGDHYWRDEHGLPSWLQIDFNGSKTINEVDVFTVADYPAYTTQADPSPTQTFTTWGLTAFDVKYWNGSTWATVPGGSVTGNNLVWKKINFTAVTTSKIRVLANTAVDGFARIAELEAWGTSVQTNLALNKPATQSTTHAPGITDAGKAVDGNTDGALWDGYSSATNYAYQSWWQVDLQSVQAIGAIEIWGRTDCCPEMTSNFYVLVSDQPFVSNDLATARAQAGVSSYYVQGYSGTPGTLNVNRSGRYVRVQLASTDYLVLAEVKVWQATGSAPIPTDGLASLSYDQATNRITTAGFAYDAAGNQVRALAQGGGSQRFKYDAANRLVQVKADDNVTVLASYTYGDSNERLISEEWGLRTYYASEGGTTIAEYFESGSSTTPAWSKSYVYLGNRLLSTLTPNGSGSETVQYHHPDRLGTRLVTDPVSGTSFEQVTLPFGTPLNAESTGATNRRFTSYDRSATTGLDYAVNRHFDPQQGRFTQVDPIGMGDAKAENPQSFNLYAYCGNDPINHLDPDGLGFLSFLKKVFGVIAKIFKIVLVVLAVVCAIVGTMGLAGAFLPFAGVKFGLIMLGLSAAGFAEAFGPPWLQKVISVGLAALGIFMMQPSAIWNFAEAAGASHTLIQALGAFMTVGAVSNFLVQHKHQEKKKRPGDYQTLNEAAIAALRAYDIASISVDRELNGSICEYPDGRLIYTVPNLGDVNSSHPSDCPAGTTRVATYHTHGANNPLYDSENFSPNDRINSNNRSLSAGHAVPNFVATPSGVMKRFDPAVIHNSIRGRVTTFKTKIRTAPF